MREGAEIFGHARHVHPARQAAEHLRQGGDRRPAIGGGGVCGECAGEGSGRAFSNCRSVGRGGRAGTRWCGRVTALQLARKLCGLRAEERAAVVDAAIRDYALLKRSWAFRARPELLAPERNWRPGLIVAGRGMGTTWTGAESGPP